MQKVVAVHPIRTEVWGSGAVNTVITNTFIQLVQTAAPAGKPNQRGRVAGTAFVSVCPPGMV